MDFSLLVERKIFLQNLLQKYSWNFRDLVVHFTKVIQQKFIFWTGFWSWTYFSLQSKSVQYKSRASTDVPKVTIKQPSSCQLLPIIPDIPYKTFAHLFKLRPWKAVPCSMLSQAHRCSEIWKLQKCFRDKAASSWTKFSSGTQDHKKGDQVYHTISTCAMLHWLHLSHMTYQDQPQILINQMFPCSLGASPSKMISVVPRLSPTKSLQTLRWLSQTPIWQTLHLKWRRQLLSHISTFSHGSKQNENENLFHFIAPPGVK